MNDPMKSAALNTKTGNGLAAASGAASLAIYQAACTFAASHELAHLSRRHGGLARICAEFQVLEASLCLVRVAAIIKHTMDTLSSSAQVIMNKPVGQLQPETADSGQLVPLGLREACNRILHADEMELLRPELKGDAIVLNYDVVLEGWTSQGNWRATLNIPKFLDVACMIA